MPKASKLSRLSKRHNKNKADDKVVVPKITNESVAEHREEVLGRARKLVNPLHRHSRSRIVKLSVGIFITTVVLFLVGCSLALYKFQSTSAFTYGVTRVLPFPVAWADGRQVSYESYLFELRHYMHYYETQQNVNFSTDSGQRQLQALKQKSLDQAVNRAYTAVLAKKHGIRVLPSEVNEQVTIARSQNRLGASDSVFQSVLRDFWGWSVDDFRHELKLELLDQKVAATLDTATATRARQAHQQLVAGANFAKLAKQVSDDKVTQAKGGNYGFVITQSNHDLPPLVVQTIFSLKPGEISDVIDTGYTLEIVKLLKVDGFKREAAHIAFNYKDISAYTAPLRQAHPPKIFINVK